MAYSYLIQIRTRGKSILKEKGSLFSESLLNVLKSLFEEYHYSLFIEIKNSSFESVFDMRSEIKSIASTEVISDK